MAEWSLNIQGKKGVEDVSKRVQYSVFYFLHIWPPGKESVHRCTHALSHEQIRVPDHMWGTCFHWIVQAWAGWWRVYRPMAFAASSTSTVVVYHTIPC